MPSPLLDFFDRIYVINLPERTDRFEQLRGELSSIGIAIDHPKVRVMHGQWSDSAHGFASLGAYGNFMSHLRILREVHAQGDCNVWILEDDAIFRRELRDPGVQSRIVQRLRGGGWDLCYLGHGLARSQLKALAGELLLPLPRQTEFTWAHCYGISARCVGPLLAYLEETLVHPPGHPRGARMYIDGALNMYRRFHPEAVTWVTSPRLSSQRGTTSNLAQRRPYDDVAWLQPFVSRLRGLRDEAWRRGLLG